jgi:hypothetical protein
MVDNTGIFVVCAAARVAANALSAMHYSDNTIYRRMADNSDNPWRRMS